MSDNAHAAAPAPTKVTHDFTLRFGLVSIPMAMYSMIEKAPNPVPRKTFTVDGHDAGVRPYDKDTGENVDEVIKKATASDGTLVELDNDEIVAAYEAAGVTSGKVVDFVPLSELMGGTYIVDTYHQVRPAKVEGRNKKKVDSPDANRAYNMLLAALAAERRFALIMLVQKTTSVPRYAALLPNGRLLVLCFAEQVRRDRPMPTEEPREGEVDMARQLIRHYAGESTPVLIDHVGAELVAYVDAKAGGVEVVAPTPLPVADTTADLMAAMAASMRAAA